MESRVQQPTAGSTVTTRRDQKDSWAAAAAQHTYLHPTLEPMENAILALRAKHPSRGARIRVLGRFTPGLTS
jgi:hypothetical protein